MEEEIKKPEYSLKPILDPETKEYSLTHFDEVKLACEDFIKENFVSECKSAEDLKALKKGRATIRKKKDFIKSTRLSLIKLFSWQFVELEKMLDQADCKLKTIKETFEAESATTTVTANDYEEVLLNIKFKDRSVIEQIKKIAVENGCTVTEIKEKNNG